MSRATVKKHLRQEFRHLLMKVQKTQAHLMRPNLSFGIDALLTRIITIYLNLRMPPWACDSNGALSQSAGGHVMDAWQGR
jgi:hypothetical protein